jgi:peptidyl-dipeptidase A
MGVENSQMKSIDLQTERYLEYLNHQLSILYSKMMNSLWRILTEQDKTLFDKFEKDEIEYQKYLSSKEITINIQYLLASPGQSERNKRQLMVQQSDMLEFQTSSERLKTMSEIWNTLHLQLSRYRTRIGNSDYTEQEVLKFLQTSTDEGFREAIWKSFMQLGSIVKPGLIQLVQYRNDIAQENGFANFFEMKLHSQELSTSFIEKTIEEIRRELDSVYKEVKDSIDQALSLRYKIKRSDIMPWHYSHPFFQYAKEPESEQKSVDTEMLKKQLSSWFEQRNIHLRAVLSGADLSVRAEKSQANFCLNINRQKDIRLSCNIGNDAQSLKLLLHELGHAFHENELESKLPFILRQPHIFISEAIALLFERLPLSISGDHTLEECEYDSDNFNSLTATNHLVRLYWSITVVEFERKLYENPLQDLNDVWWSLVEEIQLINRPNNWDIPCWAAKPHLTTLPVYYHNYLIGDILAAQFEETLTHAHGSWFSEHALQYLKETIVKPGKSRSWSEVVTSFNQTGFSTREYIDQINQKLKVEKH